MGEMRNAYKISDKETKCNSPLGRPNYRWEDIKTDIKDT
jgi:hypothetical protein